MIVIVGPGVGLLTDLAFPGEGIFEFVFGPTWICLNVDLNERNWDRNYFSHVTHALYVLEIIMAVHEIENQIIKEFDRFISIFSINLEFCFC